MSTCGTSGDAGRRPSPGADALDPPHDVPADETPTPADTGRPAPTRKGRTAARHRTVPAGQAPGTPDPLDVPTGEMPAADPLDVPAGEIRKADPLDVPTGEMPADPLDVPTGEMAAADPLDVPTGQLGAVPDVPTGQLPATGDGEAADRDGPALPMGAAPGDGALIVLSDRELTGLPPSARVRRDGYTVPAAPPSRPGRDWVDLVDRWFPERYRIPTVLTTAVALVLAAGFLFLPVAGTDLSAEVARGHFFAAHGAKTVDFRWYGGTYPFGYSILAGPLNALIGARGVGAVSCVVAAAAFAWLLARYHAPRPAIGGVLAAVVGVCNLISGRTTFGLGLAMGMLALVAVSLPRGPRRGRLALGLVLAALSTATSPLAGLFVGMAGGAALLAGVRRPTLPDPGGNTETLLGWLWYRARAWLGPGGREGVALAVGAAIGLAPVLMFDDGGRQPFTSDEMKVFIAVGVATFFLLPARYRVLRVAAVLLVLLTVGSYLVHSPIGSNVTRLPMLYSAPLIAAVGTVDRRLLAGAVLALTWWQPPLVSGDLTHAGDRTSQAAYYDPLIAKLRSVRPVGRVEVVPLYNHWDATYVAESVPMARGWQRQVDVRRNPIFYDDTLAPDTYLAWLYHNAVGYVAVPKGARLDKYGQLEASLIAAKLPYLKRTWSSGDWTLYRVVGAQDMVSGQGVLVDSGPTGVVFDAPVSGEPTVRVRWSRWLTLSGPGGCLSPAKDGWTRVRVTQPGRYRISSGWHLFQPDRC